jgi:hypothetical protein
MNQPKTSKQLLFSITKKDFVVEYYNPGKNGGQNVNKVATACRIHHPASGAIATCREERYQKPNRERAFKRILETPKFKKWLKIETAKCMGLLADIDAKVEKAMAETIVEISKNDKWVKVSEDYFDNLVEE